ncbi:MAG TPA: hypothetical protein VGR70_00640 [Stellaceae bacterium]|nr:hypothetical protein [Stellaceae bacterium]
MIAAERLLVAAQRRLRDAQRLFRSPGRNKRDSKAPAYSIGLRMAAAEDPLGFRQQILTVEDSLRQLVLRAQRRIEGLFGNQSQGDQVLADPTATHFLARQRGGEGAASNQVSRQQ